jgi:hypothetical protein
VCSIQAGGGGRGFMAVFLTATFTAYIQPGICTAAPAAAAISALNAENFFARYRT